MDLISQITSSDLFVRLCKALLCAEYTDFQTIDDSGGDSGNDGYSEGRSILFQIYCPEKPEKADDARYKEKIIEDLDKAKALVDSGKYKIDEWIFITPRELREPVQTYLREEAANRKFKGIAWASPKLGELFAKYPHLRSQFSDLIMPDIENQLEAARTEILDAIKGSDQTALINANNNSGTIFVVTTDAVRQLSALSQKPDSEMTLNLGNLLPAGSVASPLAEVDSSQSKEKLVKRIDESVALLNLNRIPEARVEFLKLLGEVKNQADAKKELARIYNNLGVTYNRPAPEGEWHEAIKYFELAIETDPDLIKAKINLANALINLGNVESISTGLDKIRALWSVEKRPEILQILFWGMHKKGDKQDIFDLATKDQEAIALIEKDDALNNLLAAFYIEKYDYQTALQYIDTALALSGDEPETLNMRGKALMIRANQYVVESELDVTPRFRDYRDIYEALDLFRKAYDTAKAQRKSYLLSEIQYGIGAAQAALGQYDESLSSFKLIAPDALTEQAQHHIDILQFEAFLRKKEFGAAYESLITNPGYQKISYREKRRLSRVFIINGAPEQAKELLNSIQIEAEQSGDIYYWIDFSTVLVLLDDHQEAVAAALKIKKMVTGTKDDEELKRLALSHYNAIMLHYSKHDDGDGSETTRLIEGTFEMQKSFPKEQIVMPIQAVDEKGEISDAMKNFLDERRAEYEGIRQEFVEKPIPFYYLENIEHRPLSDLILKRGDPAFTIHFTETNEAFVSELAKALDDSESLIFDYLSLIDLAQMDFLGFLERLGKKIYIHDLLFQKIQQELLQSESPQLRRLWNFLRRSKNVHLLRDLSTEEQKKDSLMDVFDEWMIETLIAASFKKIVLVTNDLHTLKYAKSKEIRSINVMTIIAKWRREELIDERMYARSLGDLAERFYIFLPYKGEELHEIVLEDKGIITLRSYHLINQIFLPGSVVESFLGVFAKFIDMFWRSGVLPKEKVSWLRLLTEVLLKFIDREFVNVAPDKQPTQEMVDESVQKIRPMLTGVVVMWKTAIKNGGKDDLEELMSVTDEILSKEYLNKSRQFIRSIIQEKIDSFSPKLPTQAS